MSDPTEDPLDEKENLIEVGKYPTLQQAHEHGLVILAMREPCWVEPQPDASYSLHAKPEAVEEITDELEAYEREQAEPVPNQPADDEWFRHPAGWNVYALWASLLIAAFIWQGLDPSLTARGASSSVGLINHHEWWRPITALFLHADAPHLLGNLLSGLFFGVLVARSLGPWLAWTLIIGCGVLGNLLTSALTWPESFTSIGASTAVFGALGILSGLGFVSLLRHRVRLPWARTTAPLLAGVVLLGWFGGGSPDGNTDVLGHVLGFAGGVTAGLTIGIIQPSPKR